eukprot:262115-Prorocentrum_minimum.AAC.1
MIIGRGMLTPISVARCVTLVRYVCACTAAPATSRYAVAGNSACPPMRPPRRVARCCSAWGGTTGQCEWRCRVRVGCIRVVAGAPPASRVCTLVPWKANELTPRTDALASTPPSVPPGRCASITGTMGSTTPAVVEPNVWTALDLVVRMLDTCKLSWRRCVSKGCVCWDKPNAACSIPTAPAAASVWPTLDLAAANTKALVASPCALESELVGASSLVALTSSGYAAPNSTGSPSAVPVPCICRPPSELEERSAERKAALIAACWAGPLGAVRELERPSWLAAVPTTHAATALVPAPSPVDSSLCCMPARRKATHASLRTYPSAALSRVLHLPSAANTPAWLREAVTTGSRMKLTPHDTALLMDPRAQLSAAM